MRFALVKLSEICRQNSPITYGILQPGPEVEGGIPYVRPSEIKDGQIEVASIRRTSPEISGRYKKSVIREGDILITIVGTIGHIATVPPELDGGNITQSSARIRICPSKANSSYVKQFLRSPIATRQYDKHRLGVAVARLNLHHVRDLEIPLPPLAEQRRIARILDAADALRALRRDALAQLDTLLQSTFLDIFGDPVTNPMGWEDRTLLGDVADIQSGLTKGRKLKNQATREVPYLAVVNVQDRHLVLDPLKRIHATAKEIRRYRLANGDLLLTEGGDRDKLGRGTLWQNQVGECIYQNHIFRVRLHENGLIPLFLSWLVGSERGKRYFLAQAKQTTGIATINKGQLSRFPLLVPPLDRQRRFAAIVESAERQQARMRAHLAELDILFASLQSRAFNGEL